MKLKYIEKKIHKSYFGWKWASTLQWAQKVSATILVSWSLLQIRKPTSYFSSAQFTSITVQLHHHYNSFFSGPQSAFVKTENVTMPNSVSLRDTKTKLYILLAGWTWRPDQCKAAGIVAAWCLERSVPCTKGVTRDSDPSWGWISDCTHSMSLVWMLRSLSNQSCNSTWFPWVSLDLSITPLLWETFIFNNLPFPDHLPSSPTKPSLAL